MDRIGHIILPQCVCKTNFKDMYLDSGWSVNTLIYDVPTPCYKCGILFTTNLLDQSNFCPNCKQPVEYFGDWVSDFQENRVIVIEWLTDGDDNYILENKKYKCPYCQKNELTFYYCGTWDTKDDIETDE